MLDKVHIWLADVVAWVQLHPEWAAFVIFLIAFTESLAIVGVLVPGISVMIAIAGLAGAGDLSLAPLLVAAIVGAILGDQISFWLGRKFGVKLWTVWPLSRDPQLVVQSEAFFQRHGGKSVALGRFIGPIRALVPAVAGMSAMSRRRFTFVNCTSALIWAPAYLVPGALLGKSAATTALPLWIAFIAIGGALLGGWILRPQKS